MKKFALNVFVFFMLITTVVFLLDSVQISDEYIIERTKGTGYEKIAWNLNLINNYPEQIKGSIIFLGPSLTQGGICDSTLNARGVRAINMGVNHPGKEMEQFFVSKIIKHNPKKIYLYLPKYELVFLHPMTPLLTDPIELLSSGQSFNIPFLTYLYKRSSFILNYLIWKFNHQASLPFAYSKHGVRYQRTEYEKDKFESIKTEQILFSEFGGISLRKIIRRYLIQINIIFNTRCQEQFLINAYAKCSRNGISMSQLYIPVVPDVKSGKIFDKSFYAPPMTVNVESVRDFSFLDQNYYWSDLNHLSNKGSIRFTEELVNKGIFNIEQSSQHY